MEAPGASNCNKVPGGAWTDAAATSLNWCPCGFISLTDGTGCMACPSGYWRGGGDASPLSNSCIRSPSGFRTLNETGACEVALCTAGTVSTWADTLATPFLAAMRKPNGTRIPADPTQCTACQGNTYAGRDGSSDCTTCRAGYYPATTNVTGTTDVYWVPPSVLELQTDCQACPSLWWKDLPNNNFTCNKCGPGSETDFLLGATTCTQCVPGYVNPSQADSNNDMLHPGAGAATYYGLPPDPQLGVNINCQAW